MRIRLHCRKGQRFLFIDFQVDEHISPVGLVTALGKLHYLGRIVIRNVRQTNLMAQRT